MLTTIPPWLNVTPEYFTNAASTGARLGLERAGLETQANDAAGRLALGYANIAGENARNSTNAGIANAAHALEAAKLNFAIDQAGKVLAQKQNAADLLNLYRFGTLGVKNRHEDNTEYGNKLRRYMHVGNQVVDLSGDQPVSVFAGPTQIDPYERMDYQAAVNRVKNAQSALSKLGPRDTLRPGAQKELDDATADLDKIRKARKVPGVSAADALNNFDQIPQAWTPQSGGLLQSGSSLPTQPHDNDPLGILGTGE